MAVAKKFKQSSPLLLDTEISIPKKQAILFGALISSTATASAIGYALYVSNSLFQESFIKLTSLGY